MISSEVVVGIHLLALTNCRVSSGFLRLFSFGIIIYTEINSTTSPNKGALSNPLVFWINVLMKIAAPRSVTVGDALYTKIVNSSFIILIIPPVRPFFSLK